MRAPLKFPLSCGVAFDGYFSGIVKAWARVLDAKSGKEMVRYDLEAQRSSGVVVCAFEKVGGAWIFEAIGEGCDGRTAKSGETMDAVRGRPFRVIPKLEPGASLVLPAEMYDDDEDVFTIVEQVPRIEAGASALSIWPLALLRETRVRLSPDSEWGCRSAWLWLDASLLIFDQTGRKIGEVDYNDQSFRGGLIVHSGDKQDEKKQHGYPPSRSQP